ncbi:MAG: hypothetical protein ACREBR_03835 [bacterium]
MKGQEKDIVLCGHSWVVSVMNFYLLSLRSEQVAASFQGLLALQIQCAFFSGQRLEILGALAQEATLAIEALN